MSGAGFVLNNEFSSHLHDTDFLTHEPFCIICTCSSLTRVTFYKCFCQKSKSMLHLFMLLFGNHTHWMIMLYMCSIRTSQNYWNWDKPFSAILHTTIFPFTLGPIEVGVGYLSILNVRLNIAYPFNSSCKCWQLFYSMSHFIWSKCKFPIYH